MSVEDPLYDAILAAPKDDAPRLVYADWLLEQGNPRGELIAAQCTVARLTRQHRRHTAEYRVAKGRSDSLVAAHGREWFDRVIGLARWEKKITRGFISHANISAKALQLRWDRFGRMPLEEVVFHRRLTNREHGPMGSPEIGRVAWLMREPGGRRLSTFGLATNAGRIELDPRLLAPALAGVSDEDETLSWPDREWPDPRLWSSMRACHLGPDLLNRFLEQRPADLNRLEELGLRAAPEQATRFFDRPDLPRLRVLDVTIFGDGSRGFDPGVVSRLARSPVLSTLTKLKVEATLDEELVRALEERAPNLEDLELAVGATDAGVRALAASSLPARLRSLQIHHRAGALARTRSADGALARTRSADGALARTRSADGALAARPLAAVAFQRLETLALTGFAIDDDTGRAFAANPSFATVVDLTLGATPTLATVEAIADSPHWSGTIAPWLGPYRDDPVRRARMRSRWGVD